MGSTVEAISMKLFPVFIFLERNRFKLSTATDTKTTNKIVPYI